MKRLYAKYIKRCYEKEAMKRNEIKVLKKWLYVVMLCNH